VAIWIGINGHLDDLPVEDVPRFQEELREYLRTDDAVYKGIRETGDLGEDLEQKLAAEIDKVKGSFAKTKAQAA
jgi:F-type H+/Na+-transporting ATPase subunit alpha